MDRNPSLTALGLELQEDVANTARENMKSWGLDERVAIEFQDVRKRTPEPLFDVVTLHNNIYYFRVEDRVELLRHIRGFLRPAGVLLLTTGCLGGSPGVELLNLWASSTQGCGRLPSPEELVEQLRKAGYEPEPPQRLVPMESFFGFVGHY